MVGEQAGLGFIDGDRRYKFPELINLTNREAAFKLVTHLIDLRLAIQIAPNPASRIHESPFQLEHLDRLRQILLDDQEQSPMRAIEETMRANPVMHTVPLTPREHIQTMYQLAQNTWGSGDQGAIMTYGQCMAVANYHPALGYYNTDYGIGRMENGKLRSAFSTPSVDMPFYSKSYANATVKAVESLLSQSEKNDGKPVRIVLLGDGEGIISQKLLASLEEKNIDPKSVEIIIGDKSASLLQKQKEAQSPYHVSHLELDARNILDFFKKLGHFRGVIIAGEELVDAFPSYAIEYVQKTGQLHEKVFLLKEDGIFADTSVFLVPRVQELYDEWVKVFPHYIDLLKRFPFISLNTSFAKLSMDISQADFEGYWIGGDYLGMFQPLRQYPDGVMELDPIRAMPAKKEGKITALKAALLTVCDTTTDADSAILKLALSYGMKPDFVGRMGHFASQLLTRKSVTLQEIIEVINALEKKYLIPSNWPSRKNIEKDYSLIESLTDLYSGKRFNWVLSKGDVPSLIQVDAQNNW